MDAPLMTRTNRPDSYDIKQVLTKTDVPPISFEHIGGWGGGRYCCPSHVALSKRSLRVARDHEARVPREERGHRR